MIVLSLLLLIGSAVCLAVGLAIDLLLLVWISIGTSALSAVFLGIGVRMRRSRTTAARNTQHGSEADGSLDSVPRAPSGAEPEGGSESPGELSSSGPVRIRTRKRSSAEEQVQTEQPEGAPMITRQRDTGSG